MALELLPASMLKAIDLLPDAQTPVTLFTRHSIREIVVGQGLAGYNLQLTEQGRDLAEAWGGYLVGNTDRVIQHCIAQPSSAKPARQTCNYPMLHQLTDLIPVLEQFEDTQKYA